MPIWTPRALAVLLLGTACTVPVDLGDPDFRVVSVTLQPDVFTVQVGDSVQLSAGIVMSNKRPPRSVTWTTSNASVATVSAKGLVRGVAAGSAVIRVVVRDHSGRQRRDSAAVTVVPRDTTPVASVAVAPPTASLPVGATLQMTAIPKDSAGNALPGRTVTWASSATGIATVSADGLVTGVAVGSATVSATSEGKPGLAGVTVTAGTGARAGRYVSPGGTSAGDGSSTRPWDLATALSGAGGRVLPGDTVWVRGGTYRGSYTSSLRGTAATPIVVRAYPGERATIDGVTANVSTLIVDGAWAIYWGLEVMNSRPERRSDNLNIRPVGVYVRNAADVKLINLVVHEVGQGVYLERSAPNIEIYGWIIYNGGNETSTRSAGHAIYIKNDGPGWKLVRDNVMFNNFGFGVHAYSDAGSGALKNIRFEGNVAFNNATLSIYPSRNLLVGGKTLADQVVVEHNYLYHSPGVTLGNLRLGYGTLRNATLTFRDNYVVGGGSLVETGYWQALTAQNNTLVGESASSMVGLNDPNTAGQVWSGNLHHRNPSARAWRYNGSSYTFGAWKTATGLGATDQAPAAVPTATRVFVRPNVYEPGRAHVVVYNWANLGAVSVDLTDVVPVGARYEVRNVQDVFGTPVASGTYGGGSILIPMTGMAPPQPIGGSPRPPLTTGPAFDVFVVSVAP